MKILFVGVDWGKEFHAVCVLREDGSKHMASMRIDHDRNGIARLVAMLRKLQEDFEVRIGIETSRGSLLNLLLKGGFQVFAMHPNKIRATRPRYTSACQKDDSFDAYIIADVLRTDGHRFPAISPDSEITQALRFELEHREDLLQDLTRSLNRLRDRLSLGFPGAEKLFRNLDCNASLAFLETWPTAQCAQTLTVDDLAQFLKNQRYSGRKKAEVLFERLQQGVEAASGQVAATLADIIRDLVRLVRTLRDQRDAVEERIEALLEAHPDAKLYREMPRCLALTVAGLITTLGDDRARYPNAEVLCAISGVSPIHFSSGKGPVSNRFRRACNKKARLLMSRIANQTRRVEGSWAQRLYKGARERGKTHPTACRIIARKWLTILWHVWIDRCPYDPNRLRTKDTAA